MKQNTVTLDELKNVWEQRILSVVMDKLNLKEVIKENHVLLDKLQNTADLNVNLKMTSYKNDL